MKLRLCSISLDGTGPNNSEAVAEINRRLADPETEAFQAFTALIDANRSEIRELSAKEDALNGRR